MIFPAITGNATGASLLQSEAGSSHWKTMSAEKVAGPEYIDMLKKAGVKLFHKVGAVRHAKHAEQAGYDGIYAAGIEEGGHSLDNDVTTMVLTPRIAESMKIPVVTVGGIATGQSLATALSLGAQGVMMASRFLASQECVVHNNIKCRTRGQVLKYKFLVEAIDSAQ